MQGPNRLPPQLDRPLLLSIRLTCVNVPSTLKFYADGLGMRIYSQRIASGGKRVVEMGYDMSEEMRDFVPRDDGGPVYLRFEFDPAVTNEDRPRRPREGIQLTIYVRGLDHVVGMLAKCGFQPYCTCSRMHKIQITTFIDPNGLTIRVVQATEAQLRMEDDDVTSAGFVMSTWKARIGSVTFLVAHAEGTWHLYRGIFERALPSVETVAAEDKAAAVLKDVRGEDSSESSDEEEVPEKKKKASKKRNVWAGLSLEGRQPPSGARGLSRSLSHSVALSSSMNSLFSAGEALDFDDDGDDLLDNGRVGFRLVDRDEITHAMMKYFWMGNGPRAWHTCICWTERYDLRTKGVSPSSRGPLIGLVFAVPNLESAASSLKSFASVPVRNGTDPFEPRAGEPGAELLPMIGSEYIEFDDANGLVVRLIEAATVDSGVAAGVALRFVAGLTAKTDSKKTELQRQHSLARLKSAGMSSSGLLDSGSLRVGLLKMGRSF